MAPASETMRFEFDWDVVKAASNLVSHKVSFEEAMTVFLDPLALSRTDDAHDEERWVTIGMSRTPRLLLVVHTHIEIDDNLMYIRIISARLPTKREKRHYEQAPPQV